MFIIVVCLFFLMKIISHRTPLVVQWLRLHTSNAQRPVLIPGLGRSPGEGNGTPLQYSCLENPMDGGSWWAAVHGVAKSQT